MTPLRRVDCHTHILPSELTQDYFKSYSPSEEYVTLKPCQGNCNVIMEKGGKFFREVEPNCFDAEVRLEEMEEANVGVQVLSTVPVMFAYWKNPADALDFSQRVNDDMISVAEKHPTRFVVLATLPMEHPDLAIQVSSSIFVSLRFTCHFTIRSRLIVSLSISLVPQELRRVKQRPCVVGIEIGTNINGTQLSDARFDPLWAECERLNAAVFVHPWDMPRPDATKYWLPWLVGMPYETTMAMCSFGFSGVLDRHPNLRVMFAHGGGSFAGTLGRICHGFECRPDLVAVDSKKHPREFARQMWVDSLVHDEQTFDMMVECFGEDKIVLGSDYPFPLGEQCPGAIVQESRILSEEAKKRILWDNAFAWMGIDDKPFRS